MVAALAQSLRREDGMLIDAADTVLCDGLPNECLDLSASRRAGQAVGLAGCTEALAAEYRHQHAPGSLNRLLFHRHSALVVLHKRKSCALRRAAPGRITPVSADLS
jgi:hypothetical protein